MSYTPTNWNTGDTITAAAMNKIENGIANAGGGNPYAIVKALSYGGSNTLLGYFVVGKLRSVGVYEWVPSTVGSLWSPPELWVNQYFEDYYFQSTYPATLPEGYVLLWVQHNDNSMYTYSGDISQTLYTYHNDSGADGCRVVTGNFTLVADNN